MKRQLLAGRFGPDDQIEIPNADDEQVTHLQLVAGEKSLDHGIGGGECGHIALGFDHSNCIARHDVLLVERSVVTWPPRHRWNR